MPRVSVFLPLLLLCAAPPSLWPHPIFSEQSIVNAASFVPAQLNGGSIARGSIFTVFGKAIGPKTGVQATAFPLQTGLAGVTIALYPQDAAQPPIPVLPLFVSDGQVNAIMPSSAPTGAGTLRITYNDGDGPAQSSPVRVDVVESSFGIFTATGRGVGPAIAFNFESAADQPLNATTASARRGQVVTLWGSGLGAVVGGDDRPPSETGAVGDMQARAQVEVWVGGAQAQTILYAGRSPGFAGLDQVNFVVPDDAALGCYSPVWVKVVGGKVSNVATLAIADAPGACNDAVNPYLAPGVGSHLGMFLPQRVRFELGSTAAIIDTASASFQDLTNRAFFFNPALSLPPRGTCLLIHPAGTDPEGLAHERPLTPLEAGGSLILRGPGGAREITRTGAGYYEALLEGAFLTPGAYTLESAGGSAVGPIQEQFPMGDLPTFRLPGDGVTIRRDRALTVSWTGGDPQNDLIRVVGVVASSAVQSARIRAMFVCTATPEQGALDVPADILTNLPASIGSGATSTAQLYVGVSPLPGGSRFEAQGLDFGAVTPIVMRGKPVVVQ
ncbi:MAG: hypothetical protein H6509_09985 [Bryobacterales bacterium]|nr:hypothetical protein [Bryobacterales bacterium]